MNNFTCTARAFRWLATAATLALLIATGGTASAGESARLAVAVGFSPGDAEALVVQTIDSARQSIDVAAYSFTSRPIASALLRARDRGVTVRVVADKSQETARYASVRYLARQGVPVRIDAHYSIMHNKFLVVDGRTVETGSFNYTRSAQLRNAENVIVLKDAPAVAAAYGREWNRLWQESEPLRAPAATGWGQE
jgi:phosphatidylserine/phosphatidylglycerophosphate/cardiolipin synthase-like enzyme